MTKQSELQTIQQQILDDGVCAELAQGATQLVFADGNPEADIVFIGEAPGKNEDIQGKPFVGAAGKFLNEMLEMIGLQRSSVYITNIVKYRPPDNRDPLPEEKKAFWPYLVRQLNVIKPKLVVTLGRHSMEYFLPNAKISQIHGEPKRIRWVRMSSVGDQGVDGVQGSKEKQTSGIDNTASEVSTSLTQQSATSNSGVSSSADEQAITSLVILPLFHPAAALYNGSMRQTLIDDFARIPMIVEKL